MCSAFSLFLGRQSLEKKLFFGIIAIAILARIFTLIVMPDAPLTDSLYHLTIARFIIQNHALPLQGISGLVRDVPAPLYHIIVAIPFTILPFTLNLFTARLFPVLFSALQLILSFVLLKRLFPKHWHFGMAFVAVQPLLIFFGSVNYIETFATCFVLLSFITWMRFSQTGRKTFLIAMPFVLGGMALSKETATILVPVFFLAFLYEIWVKKPAKLSKNWLIGTAYFAIASIALSSTWFLFNFSRIGRFGSIASAGSAGISALVNSSFSMVRVFLFPLSFNTVFWNFLSQAFNQNPMGISPGIALTIFSAITFPVFALILYGLVKGVMKKDKASILLLLCSAIAFVALLAASTKEVYIRMFVPVIPLFGIAFCNAFRELNWVKLKKVMIVLFVLTAIYSVVFTSLYAMHFYEDYSNHVPLYNFIKELPEDSVIVLHPNKFRQVRFIAERGAIANNLLVRLSSEEVREALGNTNATHIAETCYRQTWDPEMFKDFLEQGFVSKVFEDKCSTLYRINR